MEPEDIKVSHYFEWGDTITGGQSQSVKNQRKMLDHLEINYTEEPDLGADILHLNNMGPKSIYYAHRARKKDTPVVIHTHQTAEDFRNSFIMSNALAVPMKPYLKYAYSLGNHLICPSEHNRKVIENYSGKEKTVISNGFDPEKLEDFENLREEYLEKYDLEPPVVFCVGHVIKRKGVRAFIETAEKMPDLDFVWFGYINPLGEGQIGNILQRRETMRLIEKAPENCHFTGYIDDIRGAFAAGDIFFFPTRNENEGIALLEAMGAGKTPVLRNIDTFEWLEHGENCLKSDGNFENEIKKLRDEETREKIGKSAKEKSRKFEIENLAEEIFKVYKKVL